MLQRNALVLIQEDALHGVTRLPHSQLQLPTQLAFRERMVTDSINHLFLEHKYS